MRVHPLAPIVALDIDGTLGDYYNHFRRFAEGYLQETLPEPNWDNTDEFSEALGLNKDVYRDIKLAYRQGGMKRSLPTIDDGVRTLVHDIRSDMGAQVWIATTRPWQRLDNIDPDTQFWIRKNLGKVDGVIYGEDKYQDLIDIAEERGQAILGVADDLPENIERAVELGLNALLRNGPHNRRYWRDRPLKQGWAMVAHSYDIYNHALNWKDQHVTAQ